jgi:processive 1,2-diacylglycerol beta-glucosyltransferase
LQLILICGKRLETGAVAASGEGAAAAFCRGICYASEILRAAHGFLIGKPGPGSLSEALAMHLPVIVECNAWTLPQEWYNREWAVEKEVGLV